MSRRAPRIAAVLGPGLLAGLLGSCASFDTPPPADLGPVRSRAVEETDEGVRAAAALLTSDELLATFGLDLEARGVQPLWLEVENGTDQPLFFIVTGLDPEYFAPLEVAHLHHRRFSGDRNRRVDEHLAALAFDNRSGILPGEVRSGFVYTNPSIGTKVVDLDLLGDEWATTLTLFVPDPADAEAAARRSTIEARFSSPELVHLEDDAELRAALADLPCCAQDATGEHVAPLNLAVVGEIDRWVPAFQRRGYRYTEVSPLSAFQRPQDAAGRRNARWVDAQPHVVRFWQTPLRFRSLPVWLAAVETPRGGRFAREPDSREADADAARDDAVVDLLYCQNLARMGFARGAGCAASRARTDGVRVALVFDERTIPLDEIRFFDWERLVDIPRPSAP